jgi:multidrug efflux pump subunit AcrB
MRITEAAARRPLSTAAVVLTVLLLGAYGLAKLPVNFLPDVTYPLIRVHIWWHGATPEELDRQVADPVERQLSTVDGLDYLESSSIEGMYTLLVNFRYGTDVDVAYQDALAAMARVARDLPKDIEPPIVIKADPSQLPVMQLTVSSQEWDLVKLREWADLWLRDQLVAVHGVAGTEVIGGLKREIRVHVDPRALERHRLGPGDIQQRLARENVEASGGRVTAGVRELIARTVGEFRSLDEIRDVVVARSSDARLLLREVADVEDAHEEVRVVTRLDGHPCVKLSVLKQADANTVEVARAMQRRLGEIVGSVEESTGPVEIAREDQVKQVTIRADAAGTSVGAALGEVRERLAGLELPTGYELRFGGQALMMAEARRSLLTVLAFALFFSFVILIVQFNQLRIPLIILSTVPVSLSGLVLMLAVTGIPVGATVVIGLLLVVAAHVTEGVLLLTYAEEIRAREQVGPLEAVTAAARTRFRPRMMTALGVLVGLLPIALNLEEGGDMLQPMAAAAVGGILVGIFVALYLTPVLYVLTARRRANVDREVGEMPRRLAAP